MKKIKFDKLVTLVVEQKEDTLVNVNGIKLILEDWVLKEEVDNLTVTIAKEIENKYTPIINKEGWKEYSQEDLESIKKEVAKYKSKEEVLLLIWDTNVLEEVNNLLAA